MKKLLKVVVGYVLMHSPIFYERKRIALSKRLHRVFDMDYLDGTLDSMFRSYVAKN